MRTNLEGLFTGLFIGPGTAALFLTCSICASGGGPFEAAVDVAALDRLAPGDAVEIRDVSLGAERITLDMHRFAITSPDVTFAVGRSRTLSFDATRVRLLRGDVAGYLGSHAYIAVTDHGSLGWIDLGAGAGSFTISAAGPSGRIRITPMSGGGSAIPVPKCGVLSTHTTSVGPGVRLDDAAGRETSAGVEPVRGLRQIEIAVETDYEFSQLFGSLNEAASYLVALYGAVSDIYQRDVDVRVDLVFARLWDDPDDLFNGPNPLAEFQDYWNENMDDVLRDNAQFFSGRRDLPWGGIAFIDGLCNSRSYSACGYAIGRFADADTPSVFNRDISVAAHELGHNAGTPHTHDLGIDTCNDETSQPQRGTIMSYCGQTFTGGTANADMRFHTGVQTVIREYVDKSACVAADCNQNGIPDAFDIGRGTSEDTNGNNVPDECEDCNDNGTLDDEDITSGGSLDVDSNGIPDECEPDCNDNTVPDAFDIASGRSQDLYGNGVPDECEADCGGAAGPDYDEIQADMSLDLNRNAILDECEDCDDDGTTDLEAVDHANDIWIASFDHTTIRSYLAQIGTLVDVSDDAGLAEPQDLVIDSARRIFVTSRVDHRVARYDTQGTYVGDFVPSGSGGLSEPAAMTFTPFGNLLVVSRLNGSVLEYDGSSGRFIGSLVTSGSGGLVLPFGIAYGPNGHLFVTSDDGRVLEYDESGVYAGDFVTVGDNGGLTEPRGLLFLPSGNLLVASYGTDQVLEYDGAGGAFVRQFNQGGTIDRLTLDQPWALRLGADGDVYVSRSHLHSKEGADDPSHLHLTNARVYQFGVDSGLFVRAYVLGVDSGIEFPTGFDFIPDVADVDCNLNLRPDACDVSDRFSADANANGLPDECEECPFDVSGSGAVDFADLLVILTGWGACPVKGSCLGDIDNSGEVGFADVLAILGEWGPCPE